MNSYGTPSPVSATNYPYNQLAKALVTALTHPDSDTQERAEQRVDRWRRVVAGMNDGSLTIGSRTPVAGWPAWVTPRVVTGGFATGEAAAGGGLLPDECETALTAGLPLTRSALFAHHLTEDGLTELTARLARGTYSIGVPEEAALLVAAWLLDRGDHAAAVELLETIEPFAGELRFSPRPGEVALTAPWHVWRRTVGDVRRALESKPANLRVETMREALTVWNPFADELLTHWLLTDVDGRVAAELPDGWIEQGRALLERYGVLAARHTLCGKHRSPRSNIGVLRAALDDLVYGRELDPRRRGLLQCAVEGMLAKRGLPGTAEYIARRDAQAFEGAQPTHQEIIRVVLNRLEGLPAGQGIPAHTMIDYVRPVDENDYVIRDPDNPRGPYTFRTDLDVPEGTAIPPAIRRIVTSATTARLDDMVVDGLIPSAEEMARVLPRAVGAVTGAEYADRALSTLMAEHYRAFRGRRSLLLLNLEHQVRIEELPWVQAVSKYKKTAAEAGQDEAVEALRYVAAVAVTGYAHTILPNKLISELGALSRHAGLDLPLVEELAADIFMGTFTPKFARATLVAAELLRGTVYDRYYGIDYAAVAELLRADTPEKAYRGHHSPAFAELCARRAGSPGRSYSAAANGTVIEQAQILTTHNLATLVSEAGVRPWHARPDLTIEHWDVAATHAIEGMFAILRRLRSGTRLLPVIKDAAYAWRQAVFFLSLCDSGRQHEVLHLAETTLRRQPPHVRHAAEPVLGGLWDVLRDGAEFDAEGRTPNGHRLLGWSVGGHWMAQRHVAVSG